MKFGKRLLEISYPGWEGNYLAYKALKQILKQLGTNPIENARIEGQFLMELMTSVHQVCPVAHVSQLSGLVHSPC
eukprot:6193464-Pleurochrysis_carterae.AAC.4